jgi:hypothetical protein
MSTEGVGQAGARAVDFVVEPCGGSPAVGPSACVLSRGCGAGGAPRRGRCASPRRPIVIGASRSNSGCRHEVSIAPSRSRRICEPRARVPSGGLATPLPRASRTESMAAAAAAETWRGCARYAPGESTTRFWPAARPLHLVARWSAPALMERLRKALTASGGTKRQSRARPSGSHTQLD